MKEINLKYGCNPNQIPAKIFMKNGENLPIEILNGNPGYINILDAINSWQLVKELDFSTNKEAAASFKHLSPAGAALYSPLTKELEKAIDKGEVDLYFDYYNYTNEEYLPTVSTFIEDYVVLGRQKDNHIITSFESLKDEKIAMLGDDSLYNYFKNNSRASITVYSNLDDLVKKSEDKIIVVDSEIYSYYQNSKFKKLKLLYKDNMMNDYKFMVKKDNVAFYDLFNYIINTNSYYNYRNSGIENLTAIKIEDSTFEQLYTNILI